jgi:hypothetical protein
MPDKIAPEEKIKNIKIKEERNESPFVLNLRAEEPQVEIEYPLIESIGHSRKTRRVISYYYRIKSYLLSFFYGERLSNFSDAAQPKDTSFVDNFFLFWFIKSLLLFVYQCFKLFSGAIIFVVKSFKDIFVSEEGEIDAPIPARTARYEFPLAFAYVSFRKHLCEFLIILIIAVSPFALLSLYNSLKTKAVSAEEHGQNAFKIITSQFSSGFNSLDSNLELASTNLQSAYDDLQNINFFLRGVLDIMPGQKGEEYRLAKKIFSAAHEVTLVVPVWKEAIESLKNEKDNIARIDLLEKTIKSTEPKISAAFYVLNAVDLKKLPEEIQTIFESARNYLGKAVGGLEETEEGCSLLKEALGNNEPKRYLLIFQNNNELRPTGGFMGSFAEITVSKGKIIKTYFPGGGTYDLKGMLTKFVVPPEPLLLVNERWEFQDSNWFPDFPTSAKKIAWFYENSGGPTVDGVISVNAEFVVKLLEFLGPIEMKEWNKVLTSANFIDEIQEEVEINYDKKENQPKKILAEFYPLILDKLGSVQGDNFIELFKIFGEAIKSKDIQFYFSDSDMQKSALLYGAGGELLGNGGDYLYVVHTNIAGGKTDGVIFETAELQTQISSDGIITNTLTINRKHNGVKRVGFSGVRNVDYVRIYVPKGSKLIESHGFERPDEKFFKTPLKDLSTDKDLSETEKLITYDFASGIKITNEFNKTVFGNWLMVDPGSEVIYTITYELPIKANLLNKNFWSYTLLLQKQSGSNPIEFKRIIDVPSDFKHFWSYPTNENTNESHFILDKDYYTAVIFVPASY